MALIEYDLLGNKTDKVAMAIELLRHFEPEDGYYVAYSGGKDSVVVASLVARGGCKHDIHYNVTTVDPPELVRFIISQFDTVVYHYTDGTERIFSTRGVKLLNPSNEIKGRVIHFEIPEIPMRKLIVKKQFPPTRFLRYCCQDLKEINGQYRVVVTGVRWAESKSRKDNQGRVTIFSGKAGKIAEETGANFSETARGGVVLNSDNAETREVVERCYRLHKTLVNPIVDWTDEDIWEYIRREKLPYCKLYDEGLTRLGCIGCPLGNFNNMRRELERWPAYKKMYIAAFDEMLKARLESGKTNHSRLFTDGEGIMKWWIGMDQQKIDENQISVFELLDKEELEETNGPSDDG